ncbi:MAG TPA: hypothetical protein ENI60_00675 [Candidatus Fraserbacteria bacterium]|nr:hypothetical protein [Candidatus Fraserbacteria bacterium]
MKIKHLTAIGFLVVGILLLNPFEWDRTGDNNGILLETPSFIALAAEAQTPEKGVNFLQQEAGISAYVKLDQAIDLKKIKGTFKTIETVSDQYIIGEIALPNLPDYADPHVYVNKEGWIVAYYSNSEPASKIVQWIGYSGGVMPRATLEDAIRQIFDILRRTAAIPFPSVHYYDFEYPAANRIMVATKLSSQNGGTETFYLTIPQGVRLFEASWSFYHTGSGVGRVGMDGTWLAKYTRQLFYGDVTSKIKVQFKHSFQLWNNESSGTSYLAVILIYQTGQ